MTIKTGSDAFTFWDIHTTSVALDSSFPALRPCRFCGHRTGFLTGPAGQHSNGVRCGNCHRHIGWLPASYTVDSADDFDVIEADE